MDSHDTSLPNLHLRQRPLERSCSLQPDVSIHTSHFYSSKRKPKNPGRSLTDIFINKATKTRASSSDPSSSLRRRTLTVGTPLITPSSATRKGKEKAPLNRSFSELTWSSLHLDDHSNHRDCDPPRIYGLSDSFYATGDHEGVDSGKENVSQHPSLTDVNSSLILQEHNAASLTMGNEKDSNISDISKEKCSLFWKVIGYILKILFWCLSVVLILTLFMLLISMYFAYERTQCDVKRNKALPLKELEKQLNTHVFGQEIAIDVILSSLKDFESDESNNFVIFWMVGWSGSGKTHTINILKNVLSSVTRAFTVIPSFYPLHNKLLLKEEVNRLYNSLDACSHNVILIDGWDEDDQPWQIVEEFVLNHSTDVTQRNVKGKTVVVLSGTHGSKYLNKMYLNLILEGRERKSMTMDDFDSIANRVSQVKKANDTTGSFVFIPFLPMELEQVQMCITEEMSKLRNSSLLAGNHNLEKVSELVTHQMDFIPASRPLLALAGCKRVQPLLRLALFSDADNLL